MAAPRLAILGIVAAVAAAGASVLTAQATIVAYRPCWGDLEPVDEDVARSAAGSAERVDTWGDLKLHTEPLLYRGTGPSMGWSAAWIVDPTSCSEAELPIPGIPGPSREIEGLYHDASRDLYWLAGRGGPDRVVLAFRRRASPGHTLRHLPLRVVDLAALALAVGSLFLGLWPLARPPRLRGPTGGPYRALTRDQERAETAERRRRVILLGISGALSVLAALLSRWA